MAFLFLLNKEKTLENVDFYSLPHNLFDDVANFRYGLLKYLHDLF